MDIWLQNLTGGEGSFLGSLVGSTIGFLALIGGALFNYRLNRLRDARVRFEDDRSVAAALYGEILLLRREISQVAKIVSATYLAEQGLRNPHLKFDRHFLDRQRLSSPLLYNALAPQIGRLAADLVLGITEFHADFEAVRTWLPQLVEDESRGFSYSVLVVLTPASNALSRVIPTLRKIERSLGMQAAVLDLDVGEMPTVIDMENELWAEVAAAKREDG